jgi:hypothetical protein
MSEHQEPRPNGEAASMDERPPMTSNELAQLADNPPDNIMLHGYRTLTEDQEKQLRELKDSALQMWNDLHLIDGSSAERRDFDHRELIQAGLKLEEMMLWVEKFFNV